MNAAGDELQKGEKINEPKYMQENNPPLSTKHSAQPPRLMPKEGPSNPLSPANHVNSSAVMASSTMAKSVATGSKVMKIASKPQIHPTVAKAAIKPQGVFVAGPGVKPEALKHKIVGQKEPPTFVIDKSTIDLKDVAKRTTTPTRKYK